MKRFAFGLFLLLAACADDTAPVPDRWSGDPDADLAAVLAQKRIQKDAAAWPVNRDAYRKAPATQIVLTESLLELLSDDKPDVLTAFRHYELLRVRFAGGMNRDREPVAIDVLRSALVESSIDVARSRMSGDRPDQDVALEVLGVARQLHGDDDEPRVRSARRWIESEDLAGLLGEGDWALAEHDGPRVLVFTDHFTLGETPVQSVLERWGKQPRLRVSLVPVWRSNVRIGIRRVPATRKEERAALRGAAKQLGLHYEKGMERQGFGSSLDLGRTASAVVVLNREGAIAGRMAGTFPSLQRLEGMVQRVLRRSN